MKRPFQKVATTYEQQVALLQQRGMIIDDVSQARFSLQHVNYYRLGADWLPFEADHAAHRFKPDTRFAEVVSLYIFDRELRLLLLDAIERMEECDQSSGRGEPSQDSRLKKLRLRHVHAYAERRGWQRDETYRNRFVRLLVTEGQRGRLIGLDELLTLDALSQERNLAVDDARRATQKSQAEALVSLRRLAQAGLRARDGDAAFADGFGRL